MCVLYWILVRRSPIERSVFLVKSAQKRNRTVLILAQTVCRIQAFWTGVSDQ